MPGVSSGSTFPNLTRPRFTFSLRFRPSWRFQRVTALPWRRHMLLLVALVLAGASGLAVAFDLHHGRTRALKADSHAWLRTGTINAHLRQVGSRDYALLAGDSHIEQLFLPALCGTPTVNAGIGGATSGAYLTALESFRFKRPPSLVILTIGTNDGNLRRVRASEDYVEDFRRRSGRLIDALHKLTPRLVVTALPPIDAERVGSEFSPEITRQLSDVLAEQCREKSCAFVDPFVEPRPALFDGIHLTNGAAAYGNLERVICRPSEPL